jgi:hypothetical protein
MNALSNFRKNVTLESAALLQAEIETCLGDLKNQTLTAVCGAIIAAVSQFKSEITLSSDVEFTTRSIQVNVLLKDPAGTNISNNIPTDCASSISEKLTGEVTLGEISKFSYNGSSSFEAQITSNVSGTGILKMLFDGKVFSSFVPGVDGNSSQIVEKELEYTFVDTAFEPIVRRDNTDKE